MVYSIALCCLHSYLFSYKIKEIQNRFILIYLESKKTYDITILVFFGAMFPDLLILCSREKKLFYYE